MNEQIQEKLEKIDNNVRWLSDRMDRYFHALGEIASCGDQANAVYLRGVAQAALDGEPTTADEFNNSVTWVSPNDPGDENDTMLKDEKLVHEREHICKHNVPKNVECPMCNTSEDRWHDTNAQILAYDKSMEEE
tara:strand:- start:53 stop:454 length:402 start_codon:yes stop_codon:yes gene_type:complete